ncbi:hypothetical protein C8Q76DRAFT_802923 [Earliella scabrosa]|nr:hypothetical protein C8Q76DRAFT_804498 [Earliella scabrosa]KAI0694687.1 hypothetical protein C8Q76DRAFT_802923 [Earliella scabrosa]
MSTDTSSPQAVSPSSSPIIDEDEFQSSFDKISTADLVNELQALTQTQPAEEWDGNYHQELEQQMHMGELESSIAQQVPLFLRSPTVPPGPELDEFSMSGTQIGHTNSLGLIPDNDTHQATTLTPAPEASAMVEEVHTTPLTPTDQTVTPPPPPAPVDQPVAPALEFYHPQAPQAQQIHWPLVPAATMAEALHGIAGLTEMRQLYQQYKHEDYKTGYKQFLQVRLWIAVLKELGMGEDAPRSINIGGFDIGPGEVQQWLDREPGYRTFGNWRTNYNFVCAAHTALAFNASKGIPRSEDEEKLWQIVQRWVSDAVLPPLAKIPQGAEHTWDVVAVKAKASDVSKLTRALSSKSGYSQFFPRR